MYQFVQSLYKKKSQWPSEDITPSCHASFFRRLLYLSLSTDGLVSLKVVTDLYNRRITICVRCVQQVSLCSNNSWSRQPCCHNWKKRNCTCVQHKVSVLLGLTTTVMSPPDQLQLQIQIQKQIINTNTIRTTRGQCIVEGRNWPLQSWVRVTSSPVLYSVYFYRADKPRRGRATKERNKNGTRVLPHIS